MSFIRKISLGGNYGDSASTYVGDIDDIWTDDITKNVLRRGDGTTPGGVIIGGAGGVSDYNSLTNKPTIPADVSDLTDSTNLLTHTDITALQSSVTTNTAAITAEAITARAAELTNSTVITVHDARLTTVETTASTNTTDISAEITRATAAEVTNATAITAEEAARISADAVVTAAQTVYTDTAIANLVDTAPGTLNTLNELADALGDDANFSTTITNSIATNTAVIAALVIPADVSDLTDTTNLLTGAAYTDASVNTHLNQSSATTGQLLSWNGIDYEWADDENTTYPIHYWTGASSIGIGNQALSSDGTSVNQATAHSVAVGMKALQYAINGSSGNVAIGSQALKNLITGDNNIAIGLQAGLNTTGSRNVFIGHNAGRDEVNSNKLYIANSSANTLIKGDFTTGTVSFNNDAYTFPSTDGTSSQVLTTDGAGNLSWSSNVTTNTAAIVAETTRATAAEAVLTAAIPTTRTTLTIDQSAISTDINNKTQINADTYSNVFVYNTPSGSRYFKLLDGSFDGQEIRINKYGSGGTQIQVEMKFNQADGTFSLSTESIGAGGMPSQASGTFVWNGTQWFRV